MQGIYNNIPETNHVPRQYSVAAILQLLFPMLNLLCFNIIIIIIIIIIDRDNFRFLIASPVLFTNHIIPI
jgi:hypothetical protein